MIAQGEALGVMREWRPALKGRHRGRLVADVTPFQGLVRWVGVNPGLRPGLSQDGLSGLRHSVRQVASTDQYMCLMYGSKTIRRPSRVSTVD